MSHLDAYLKTQGIDSASMPTGMFPMKTSRYNRYAWRKGIKKFLNPKNALDIIEHLPEPGGYTLGMVNGNFVFGDIIEHLMPHRGKVLQFACSTLSLSVHNAEMLIEEEPNPFDEFTQFD